jgi:lysine-ketoglutarate reductase/saccharopine dehydrogenase-like protein (TIGR00300 family)
VPFVLPDYNLPSFEEPPLVNMPPVIFRAVIQPGVAPAEYHATSIFPEYYQIEKGDWKLLRESRMDCVAVMEQDGSLKVKPFRHLEVGDLVACGRRENGEDGIFVHATPFDHVHASSEKFAFRTHVSRETSFSIDYDELYDLLDHERRHGFILWVLGPAVVFDKDARESFVSIIDSGFAHGLLAGNALAVHDIEGTLFGTALGLELYSKRHAVFGHYKHLDAINRVRAVGSIEQMVAGGFLTHGIMHAIVRHNVPYVLAGSIRDDGPLPDVVTDVCEAQDQMRTLAARATTVIAMATQLHAIATGNMIPCYRVMDNNRVRPVYFYSVDMSEFAINKLTDRGSLTAHSILTNVQDFVVILERGLRRRFLET